MNELDRFMEWAQNAHEVEKIYGGYVDRDEQFYLCPECEEPIYECDWDEDELADAICPICGFGKEE